ncbi:MAG: AAA family ATPase [Patescibacteria group bacterium]
MLVIGITGTLGSGKGTVVQHLTEKGFSHYSARDLLYEEVMRRGMPRNRDSLTAVGESLRGMNGPSYVIDTLYARAEEAGKDAVIESVRAVGEAESLKSKGAILISVDADSKVRYERILWRASDTDRVSFDRFLLDEKRESEGREPGRMNIPASMALADFAIQNDGTVEELHRQVDRILATVWPT